MSNVSRRSFMGAMGATAVAMANASIALADNESMGIPAEKALGPIEVITPAHIEQRGGSTMSLDELNRRRQEFVDSKTEDYVREDGTVVPNVYVKLRALVNTYGIGLGNDLTDGCWDFWLNLFSEEEAQAYLEMPKGVFFTALTFSEESGRELAACQELLAELASRGALFECTRSGTKFYHHTAFVHGSCEYTLGQFETRGMDYIVEVGKANTDVNRDRFMYDATPFYYAVPCDESVIIDGEFAPYDNWEKILDSKETFATVPCYCKTSVALAGGQELPKFGEDWTGVMVESCGHPIETCLLMGEEAEFFINGGYARPITRDEAKALIRRNVESGLMLESCHSKETEVLCSCHVSCCGHLKFYKGLPAEEFANSNVRPHVSHYELVYDKDACLKCGACVDRCPMMCIAFDEDGFAVADAHCFRCGQCGMVCPVDARKLRLVPEEEWGVLPQEMLDDENMKAAFRFEHGLIW